MSMNRFNLNLLRKDDGSVELQIHPYGVKTPDKVTTTTITKTDIDALLQGVTKDYHIYSGDLIQRGEALYQWLDQHTSSRLRDVLSKYNEICLIISGDAGLRHLPWELLHDGDDYLCGNKQKLFTPLRLATHPDTKHDWELKQRQLGVLFMASSPKGVSLLEFEAEEKAIIKATMKKPLAFQVEESGTLEGLADRLVEYKSDEAPDVIHLSGHADINSDEQPIFKLEDDEDLCSDTTPHELARTLHNADVKPKLVFLSGCRTGESNHQDEILSFSEQLAQAGIPIVLGWALNVGDKSATHAAATLYEKLAIGMAIDKAVAQTRRELREEGSKYWHLLRCFVDGSEPKALVGKKGRVVRPPRYEIHQDFVGRRHLIKHCLRSLRSWVGNEQYAEGVLLYGTDGTDEPGKSSVAKRLVNRLQFSHKAVKCFGGLNEMSFLSTLYKALPEAQALLNNSKLSLEQQLRKLFAPDNNPYCDKALLLVFDGFEHNIPLKQREVGQAYYAPEALNILNTALQAIHYGGSDARIIITSQFEVPVAAPCILHTEKLQTPHPAG